MDQIQLKLKTLTLTGKQTDRVRFNVRGKIFETSATTLASVSRSSMFGAMLDYEWNQQQQAAAEGNKEYFIDRDPDCFNVLLNLLGTGEFYVPPNIPEKLIYTEAHYYGLVDHVRSAQICKFNFNWLKVKRSIRDDEAPCNLAGGRWNAIRASPDGGCAVAQDSVVRVYNWLLEERPPINLDFKRVGGIEWMDLENIVMGCQNISGRVGGMGVFSSSTGELRHRFRSHDGIDEVNNFAEALCFDSDGRIFASCRGTSRSGIGLWDQVTGQQIDFFNLRLDDTAKIQWLNGRNCLFVNKRVNPDIKYDYIYRRCISLWDVRDKSIVWSMLLDDKTLGDNNYIVEAIPVEESDSICVGSNRGNLGSVDLRSTSKSVKWNPNPGGQGIDGYCQLILHGGQLFSSMGDKISVYYGGVDQWVLTSSLRRAQHGLIRDFSIGGDRLFALHMEENVFDVWETPSAPII